MIGLVMSQVIFIMKSLINTDKFYYTVYEKVFKLICTAFLISDSTAVQMC